MKTHISLGFNLFNKLHKNRNKHFSCNIDTHIAKVYVFKHTRTSEKQHRINVAKCPQKHELNLTEAAKVFG